MQYCGSVHGVPLFEHHCKFLLKNEYDEDGEWVDGGDWCLRNFQIIKRRCDDMKYCDFEKLAYLCQKYGFKTMGDIVLFLKKHDLNIYEFFEILKKGGEKVENAF